MVGNRREYRPDRRIYESIFSCINSITWGRVCTTPDQPGKEPGTPTEATPGTESNESLKVNSAPKDAVQSFVDALKAKDEKAVKAALSSKTNKLMELQTKMTGKGIVDVFSSDDFDEVPANPQTQNEKIDGDKATIEVKDEKDEKWETIPLVKEDGSWKLAFGDETYDKEYDEMVKQVEALTKEKEEEKDSK